jgi:amino acid transporter
VASLILNRTIGTGIFAQPVNVLALTGSSGVALTLWFAGGIIIFCILLCWLELGMTIPFFKYVDEEGNESTVSTPRSGGDKNFLEYIYNKPRLLASCIFGVIFIVFGHLAANALQAGIFIMMAVNPACREGDDCFSKGGVVGWAIGLVTLCAFINISARQFAITMNNIFAVAKVLFVIILGFMGIIWGSQNGNQCTNISWKNQNTGPGPTGGSFGDIILALVFAAYPYTGFEQPFYVLAEVRSPKKTFPTATITAMLIAMVIFPLANVGYLCVTPYTGNENLPGNMVIAMFERIAGVSEDSLGGKNLESVRAVSALLFISIFGNIMAQTFTASRVKQEIAKEGVIPYWKVFSKGSDSLFSRIWTPRQQRTGAYTTLETLNSHPEQVPIAATILHWAFEVLLILVFGIPMSPTNAYRLLTAIKMYTIVGVLGLVTVAGLGYLKIDSWIRGPRGRGRQWYRLVRGTYGQPPDHDDAQDGVKRGNFLPPLDPLHVVIATLGLIMFLFGPLVKPTVDISGLPYWLGPFLAFMISFASVGWWVWLKWNEKRNKVFIYADRKPFLVVEPDGEVVCKAEVVCVREVPIALKSQMMKGVLLEDLPTA